MKMTARYWLAVASGLILAGTASAALLHDDFESYTDQDPLDGVNGWKASSTNVKVQLVKAHDGTKAAIVPQNQTLTNVISAGGGKIWSDFFTIPRRYSSETSAGPDPDTNATAQIYITTNGYWAAICRAAVNGPIVTNEFTTDTNIVVGIDDSNTWQHVSVLHDYDLKKWSLFVSGVALGTNLTFINTGVNAYAWFKFKNGDANDAWLDDVTITNKVPSTLITTTGGTNDADGDGLSDPWEIMTYGSTGATDQASAYIWGGTNTARILELGAPANGSNTISLVVQVNPDRTYELLGGTDPAGISPLGITLYTGENGENNQFVDLAGLSRARYFYRLRSTSPQGAIVTNEETYAWYRQERYGQNNDYMVGIPVDYGTNNVLNGLLGADLARGLAGGDEGDSDRLYIMSTSGVLSNYWLNASKSWRIVGSGLEATAAVRPGAAVWIQRKSLALSTTNSVLAGLQRTTGIALPINEGWNLIGWPYDAINAWAWGLTNATTTTGDDPLARDEVHLKRTILGESRYITVIPRTNGSWRVIGMPAPGGTYTGPITNLPALQPGEAFYYRRAVGSTNVWAPVKP